MLKEIINIIKTKKNKKLNDKNIINNHGNNKHNLYKNIKINSDNKLFEILNAYSNDKDCINNDIPYSDDYFPKNFNKIDPKFLNKIIKTDFWGNIINILNPEDKIIKNPKENFTVKEEISAPVSNIYEELKNLSIKLFFKILKSYYDGKLRYTIILSIIKLLICNSIELIDELYLMLLMQYRKNTAINKKNILKIFSIVCSILIPSEYTLLCLLNYFYYKRNKNKYFTFIFNRLIRMFSCKRVTVIPTKKELKNIKKMKKIKLKINYKKDLSDILWIEPDTDILKIKEIIFKKYNINNDYCNYFSLLEVIKVNNTLEYRIIEEETLITEIKSSWNNELIYYKKNNIDINLLEYSIYFKYNFSFGVDNNDDINVVFKYLNNIFNFENFLVNIKYQCLIELLGLLIILTLNNENNIAYKSIIEDNYMLSNYIASIESKENYKKMVNEIFEKVYSNTETDDYHIIKKINSLFENNIKNNPLYFNIKLVQSRDDYLKSIINQEIIIGVDIEGIYFYNNLTFFLLIGYKNICNWGYSENSFALIISENEQTHKLTFETTQPHIICYILNCYVRHISGGIIKKNKLKNFKNVSKLLSKNIFLKETDKFMISKYDINKI